MAFDNQCVGIHEFDVNVVLLDAGEFTGKFVAVSGFSDVEFGGEGASVAVLGGWVGALGGGLNVKETEEGIKPVGRGCGI